MELMRQLEKDTEEKYLALVRNRLNGWWLLSPKTIIRSPQGWILDQVLKTDTYQKLRMGHALPHAMLRFSNCPWDIRR